MMLVLDTACVRQKLAEIETACHEALLGRVGQVPLLVARDLEFKDSRELSPREGLSTQVGRARMLHDLGNIELQAMELALRTLNEYPDAPTFFREELAALTLSEASHLKLCLDALEKKGFRWGDWPIHLGLWNAVKAEDSLIDRVLIVHRYFEGSGLDAGDKMLRRLRGLPNSHLEEAYLVMDQIHREEIPHVDFGSRWYRELCRLEGLDAADDFGTRMARLRATLPYRTEKMAVVPRLRAGFTMEEIAVLEKWRVRSSRPDVKNAIDLQGGLPSEDAPDGLV